MTYEEMAKFIATLDDNQKKQDITIFDNSREEFFPLSETPISTSDNDDILDKGHIYLNIN